MKKDTKTVARQTTEINSIHKDPFINTSPQTGTTIERWIKNLSKYRLTKENKARKTTSPSIVKKHKAIQGNTVPI